jgi:hypothetical protein
VLYAVYSILYAVVGGVYCSGVYCMLYTVYCILYAVVGSSTVVLECMVVLAGCWVLGTPLSPYSCIPPSLYSPIPLYPYTSIPLYMCFKPTTSIPNLCIKPTNSGGTMCGVFHPAHVCQGPAWCGCL